MDTVLAVFCLIELRNLLGYHATHDAFRQFDYRYVHAFAGRHRCNLKTDVSCPDDDKPFTLAHILMHRRNVLNVSQVMHTR